jgi:hypothetical protein
MQNKPNLPDSQINVSKVLTKDYENDNAFRPHENKAKTNPKQTQSKPISKPALSAPKRPPSRKMQESVYLKNFPVAFLVSIGS